MGGGSILSGGVDITKVQTLALNHQPHIKARAGGRGCPVRLNYSAPLAHWNLAC